MKKYTIKQFAEGKKAVKIKNKEQWNKLNKVHKLCGFLEDLSNVYYTNQDSWERQVYLSNTGWELLEFSQLDFEDEFVVGKWYKYNNWYLKFEQIHCGIFQAYEAINDQGMFCKYQNPTNFGVVKDGVYTLCKDLSEIQHYLSSNHPDLIKQDTFVLPEKWRLKITPENKAIVNEWKLKQKYKDDLFKFPEYTHVNSDGEGGTSTGFENKDFITFEQFQQYVLKTEKTMEKEIIGYKLKFDEYKKAALKVCNTVGNWENSLAEYDISVKQTRYVNELKEAGVLDLWFEAVYAPEKPKLPTINRKQCVDNGDKTITCGCTTKSFDWILGVAYAMEEDIYISDTKVTRKEIKQIIEYINNNK